MAIMPIEAANCNVFSFVNPLDPEEIFLQTTDDAPCLDLPRMIEFLPAEWADARFHRFEPNETQTGMFVLRMDVPEDHDARRVDACLCTACEAFRAVRLDLVLPIAVDSLIADALEIER